MDIGNNLETSKSKTDNTSPTILNTWRAGSVTVPPVQVLNSLYNQEPQDTNCMLWRIWERKFWTTFTGTTTFRRVSSLHTITESQNHRMV